MDQTLLFAIVIAAAIGLAATLFITRRDRRAVTAVTVESPFAVSTEGSKLCPSCGMGNLVTDGSCISCGAKLPG